MTRRLVGTSLEFPEAFALRNQDVSEPGTGQVGISVKATGLGFVDGLLVQGRYQIKPMLPYVPGGEIAGIIDAVGTDVAGLAIGDHVATWQLGGGLADSVIVDAADVDPVDPDLPLAVVAAMLVDFQTARHALFDRGQLRAGETVLALGASGGAAGGPPRHAPPGAGCQHRDGARQQQHALSAGALARLGSSRVELALGEGGGQDVRSLGSGDCGDDGPIARHDTLTGQASRALDCSEHDALPI